MSDYNPTDDELRALATSTPFLALGEDVRSFARLVLRERETAATVAAVLGSQTDNVIATEKLADGLAAQRDQERARAEQAELETDDLRNHLEIAEAERDQARAALARVEALKSFPVMIHAGTYLQVVKMVDVRAAIAQPPAAGKDPSCAATTSTHPASGAERVSAGTAAIASTSADAAIAGEAVDG